MEEQIMNALGEEGFTNLVAGFYRRVKEDNLLAPMYPDSDWENAERRLRDFLVFRFGGSDRYIQERGHPRLRMRHMPFSIGEAERDRWLDLMRQAMDESELEGDQREHLERFFSQTADFMRNRAD